MALENDKQFQMRVSADFLKSLDEWRRSQPDLPGRAEAIRRLVEAGIKTTTPLKVFAKITKEKAG